MDVNNLFSLLVKREKNIDINALLPIFNNFSYEDIQALVPPYPVLVTRVLQSKEFLEKCDRFIDMFYYSNFQFEFPSYVYNKSILGAMVIAKKASHSGYSYASMLLSDRYPVNEIIRVLNIFNCSFNFYFDEEYGEHRLRDKKTGKNYYDKDVELLTLPHNNRYVLHLLKTSPKKLAFYLAYIPPLTIAHEIVKDSLPDVTENIITIFRQLKNLGHRSKRCELVYELSLMLTNTKLSTDKHGVQKEYEELFIFLLEEITDLSEFTILCSLLRKRNVKLLSNYEQRLSKPEYFGWLVECSYALRQKTKGGAVGELGFEYPSVDGSNFPLRCSYLDRSFEEFRDKKWKKLTMQMFAELWENEEWRVNTLKSNFFNIWPASIEDLGNQILAILYLSTIFNLTANGKKWYNKLVDINPNSFEFLEEHPYYKNNL